MLELLFGRISSGLDLGIIALSILGSLALCAALLLLGRRNELGWWLVAGAYLMWGASSVLSFPPRSIDSPLALILFALGIAVPLFLGVGIGVYGLLSFQKYPRDAPLTRAIGLRQFKGTDLVAPLAVAVVFGIAALIPALSTFATFGLWDQLPPGAVLTVFIWGILGGLLPAGLVGLAHRCRWAWFLLVVPPLVDIYSAVVTAGGSVKIFLSIATIGLAVYGWGRWGGIPAAPVQARR